MHCSIHKGFCFCQGISSPISDLTERLLLEERDPPAIPQESLYEAPPFDEVWFQVELFTPLSLSLPLFLLSLPCLYYHIHFYIKTQVDIQALAHAVKLTRQGAVDSLRFAKGDLFQAFQVTFQIFMTYYLC